MQDYNQRNAAKRCKTRNYPFERTGYGWSCGRILEIMEEDPFKLL